MIALKIAATAIICAVLYLAVKQEKPEYAVFVQLAGITVIGIMSVDALSEIAELASEMTGKASIEPEYIALLIKAVGIAAVSDISAGICKDNGATALSGTVEIAAKAAILTMSIPMIRSAAQLMQGLLD